MKTPLYRNSLLQILFAIACGVVLGYADPAFAVRMQPLGDGFIFVIRILAGPTIFFTVASGVAAMGSIRQLGRVGVKAILYFETLSALALITGLIAAKTLEPGAAFSPDLAAAAGHAQTLLPAATVTSTLPQAVADIFVKSVILQILALAVLSGIVVAMLGDRGVRIADFFERIVGRLFLIVNLVLKAAPLATFGAIAFTVGKYGLGSVGPLLKLLGVLNLASILFVLIVLGMIARLSGFRILRFIGYIKEELMIVCGTSSSIAAMPRLIEKMERAGCPKSVAGVVVPAGYSFNLNGTSIYLTTALAFLAQALNIELSLAQCLGALVVAMVTSKGASGVAGSAFIALAATLAAVPAIPDDALVLIFGIERLLKCRSLTNIIGNGVACLAVSAWVGKLDREKLRATNLE